MSDQLLEEVRSFWNQSRPQKTRALHSPHKYRGSSVKIIIDVFEQERFTLYLELIRDHTYQAKQEISFGNFFELDGLINSEALRKILEQRLETLHEAIEEMLD